MINGETWFSSNARWAEFLIVMAVTDPEAAPYKRMSMFIVPTSTPGVNILRNAGYAGEPEPGHAYIRYENVRVPADHLLGGRGEAFAVAQTRLGGGRIHHAMRTIGEARKAFEMMCERALSRFTQGQRLADKQLVQAMIADSWIQLEQFRLLVLRTAWLIDKHQDYRKVRKDISAVKVVMPKVLHDIAANALNIHGSLGLSDEMPFMAQIAQSFMVGLADGPTEVHKVQVARQVLGEFQPTKDLFPAYHLPRARAAAALRYPELAELVDADA